MGEASPGDYVGGVKHDDCPLVRVPGVKPTGIQPRHIFGGYITHFSPHTRVFSVETHELTFRVMSPLLRPSGTFP